MGLTIIGAVLLITGLLMVIVGEALRLKPGHGGTGIAGAGELVAFCGLGIGVALLVVLAVGRPDRGPADRARGGRARTGRVRGDGRGRDRRRGAVGAGGGPGRRRDTAEEWLGPLRTAGARVTPQHVAPYWPEPAGSRPEADDYTDDGWHPDLDEEWSPGPAYVWSPGEEGGWDNGADGDWNYGGDQEWNLGRDQGWGLGQPAGITAWPQPPRFASDLEPEYPGAAGTDIPAARFGNGTAPTEPERPESAAPL